MKHPLLFLIVLSTVNSLCYGQLSSTDIFDRSRKFYDSRSAGHVIIQLRFKSSIAEAVHISDFSLDYCRNKKLLISNSADGRISSIYSAGKYCFINQKDSSWIDDSRNKESKQELLNDVQQYPFYSSAIFTELAKRKWKTEIKEGLFHLSENNIHYYLDSSDYSMRGFKEFVFSEYGMQVKEWKITQQLFYSTCPDSLQNALNHILKKYKQKQTMEANNPDWIGKNIAALLTPIINSNKYLLLDFFTQSCMPCIASFPDLKALHKDFADSGLLKIVGLDPNPADSSTMPRFIKRYKLEHEIIAGDKAMLLNKIFNPINMVPFYMLVDPSGKVVAVEEGFNEKFFEKVRKLIAAQKHPD